jgi:hypothetical protein
MQAADKIDPLGCIFSHECWQTNFADGVIVSNPGPHEVVHSIIEHFAKADIALTGRHVTGATGAFWRRSTGIPVLDNAVLLDLVQKI